MTAVPKPDRPAGVRARRPEPERRRSDQPVHRGSRMDGPWVEGFWRKMTWSEKHDLVKAARRYDRANKKPGDKNGPIGSIGLELLEELAAMAVNFSGRVRPTLVTLAARIRRSKSTVVEYLRRLADAGVVEWVRRLVPKQEAEPWARGPQVEQTSNAYRLTLPERLRKFVRKGPPAADEAARKAEMRARIDAHIREEGAERIDAAIARGRARGEAANRAASLAQERESSAPTETGQEIDRKASILRTDRSS